MTLDIAIEITQRLIALALTLASPILGTALIVGIAVSIAQTVTSIQEQTLSFVPKLLAIGAVIMIAAGWMLQTLAAFCIDCIQRMALLGS
jgi:flagellar biosynthetic protein FliQ